MKYKEGDIVKIVARNTYSPLGRHDFKIGEVVRIEKVITDRGTSHYRAEYLDEHDFWYVLEEEVADCKTEQKETTTMKYKEGDIVKIVACKYRHKFDIGEIVKITKKDPDGDYCAEYFDGHDYWWVGDDEIEPANNIITRPRDYTGCDPEIAEALKQGLDVYCEVWDSKDLGRHNTKGWISSYRAEADYPYLAIHHWKYARPVRQEPTQEDPVQKPQPKTKLVPKPASEIFAWLENPENGYRQTVDGKFWEKENEPTFTERMTKYCGRDSLAGYEWHPAWLREVVIEEKTSENSENEPETYKVGDVVEVTNKKLLFTVLNLGIR